MQSIKKLLDASECTLVAVCVAAFAAMFLLGVTSVFFRFVLEKSLSFPDELLRYLFVWTTALGSAVVYRRNMHAAISIFINFLPGMWRKSGLIIATLSCLAFFVLILISGYHLTVRAVPQISPALEVSMAWVYAALPVGMAFMLIYSVEFLFRQIATPASDLLAEGQ